MRIVMVALVLAVCLGCADKKTIRTIQQLAPVIDKPPIDCPNKQCRHGQECVPCEDGENGSTN